MLWLKQIQTMSLETKEHKQRLIDCFVNAVYLYDDKLVITFNYKEASKTVTLKEVNGSIIECSGAPINPIVNDTFTMGFIFVRVGLEPEVRVWGASRPPPVAESREASEWQRSVCNAAPPWARRTPGTATGHRHNNTYRKLIQSYSLR